MRRVIFLLVLSALVAGCTGQATPALSSPTPASTPPPEVTPVPESVPWWKEAVFYEIFVRSFYDSNGDGIGDLNGLTQKLDYLNDGNPDTHTDLGITAIWLMPIHPSPSYHGYDVVNYYAVNTDYGTMEDFQNFLTEAHERGIKVIIDLVLNHTSTQHPFFVDALKSRDSEYHDWYVWSDVNLGNMWHLARVGSQEMYYYGYFCPCMPDLNYENPKVTEQMEKVTQYWLGTIGVDGFRVDAAKHLIEEEKLKENSPATHEWFKNYYLFYKGINPDAYAVGEVAGVGASVIKTYTGDQFDQIFSFELASGIVNSVNGEATSGIKSAVSFTLDDMPDWNFGTFLTNHDQDRVMSVLGGNVEKAKNAAFILLTSPGTPYLYYGEEIGMMGRKPDELIRRPMQWSDEIFGGFSSTTPWEELDPAYTDFNVKGQIDDPTSLLSVYRDLIALRAAHPALALGDYFPVDSANRGIYAFMRQKGSETLLVVVNLTRDVMTDYSLEADDTNLSDADYSTTDLISGTAGSRMSIQDGGFSGHKPLDQLEPYTGYIFTIVK